MKCLVLGHADENKIWNRDAVHFNDEARIQFALRVIKCNGNSMSRGWLYCRIRVGIVTQRLSLK
jgi:hypothetical protein